MMATPWIHELRNAINAVSTNAAVVRLLLERGEAQRAAGFNEKVLKACERSRVLLEHPPAPWDEHDP